MSAPEVEVTLEADSVTNRFRDIDTTATCLLMLHAVDDVEHDSGAIGAGFEQ